MPRDAPAAQCDPAPSIVSPEAQAIPARHGFLAVLVGMIGPLPTLVTGQGFTFVNMPARTVLKNSSRC